MRIERDDAERSSRIIVETFFIAKERHDFEAVIALLADDVVYTFPLPASGAQEDWFVYDGKEAVAEYQRKLMASFSQIRMRDMQVTVGESGKVVFTESRGDYVTADGRPYKNVYAYKFVVDNGKIARITEYCNPVTYALLVGLPIAEREEPISSRGGETSGFPGM